MVVNKGSSQTNKFDSWFNLGMDFIYNVTTGQKQCNSVNTNLCYFESKETSL